MTLRTFGKYRALAKNKNKKAHLPPQVNETTSKALDSKTQFPARIQPTTAPFLSFSYHLNQKTHQKKLEKIPKPTDIFDGCRQQKNWHSRCPKMSKTKSDTED